MQLESQSSAADRLYPNERTDTEKVIPQKPAGMDPHEYALRQLYPSMYGTEWMEKFYERWKNDWD